MDYQKIAEKYAIEHGYREDILFFKMWRSAHVFKITHRDEGDFGEPHVITVESSGKASIRPLFDVL